MRLFRPEPAFRSGFSLSPDDRPSPRLSGGHCSRPASSTPRKDRPQVRSARDSSLAPVCPGVGDLNAAARCPEFNPSIPVSPRISASPSGGVAPSGSLRLIRFGAGKLAFRNTPISRGSPQLLLLLRFVALGPRLFRRLTVPQTSWNHYDFPPGTDLKSIGF